jgi:hypothetical protein
MSGETGFQNVHWDGAVSRLYDQDAVDTVLDAIYHLGFQIDNGRLEGAGAALDEIAFWLNELLAPELAAGTLANPHIDSRYHGTTGTGLDMLVETIVNDAGLNDNLSQRQINDGAAAADAMNGLIVDGIKATGIADDGDLTSLDVIDLGHWIAAHHLAEWTALHGDDVNGKETGFHLVENDGSRSYLYFEDAVDTIAEGIFDMGFGTQWDRFKNEDGRWRAATCRSTRRASPATSPTSTRLRFPTMAGQVRWTLVVRRPCKCRTAPSPFSSSPTSPETGAITFFSPRTRPATAQVT